jgi:ribosomal protein L21
MAIHHILHGGLKMYAIIKAGGKQYTVKPGDVLRVEKMEADLGAELKMNVLMVGGEKTFVGDKAGSATVTVVVTNQQRGPKLIVFKKKRRQGYRRMGGLIQRKKRNVWRRAKKCVWRTKRPHAKLVA